MTLSANEKLPCLLVLSFVALSITACGVGQGTAYDMKAPGEGDEHQAALESAFPGQQGEVRTATIQMRGQTYTVQVEQFGEELFFEGDIRIEPEMIVALGVDTEDGAAFDDLGSMKSELAALLDSRLWPNGVVPYIINTAMPNTYRVTDAIKHWQSVSNVRFVPRTNQAAYVEFQPGSAGSGCWATIGRTGSRQIVNLDSNCGTGTAIHEIGHTLGLFHGQARTDRDQHVKVLWENITAGKEHNFRTYTQSGYSGRNVGAYDTSSIMHYASYSFSSNGRPTLTRLDGGVVYANRTALTATDISGIRTLYPNSAEVGTSGTVDAGTSTVDAGTVDAGTVDAGTSTGTGTADAGTTQVQVPTAFVIDSNNTNNTLSFATVSYATGWTSSTNVSGYYGTGYRYASPSSTGGGVTFAFYLPAAGYKTIDAWWSSSSTRNSQTPFKVYDAYGHLLATVSHDQRTNGGRWNLLGTFKFSSGWNKVVVSRATTTSGHLIADAVRVR